MRSRLPARVLMAGLLVLLIGAFLLFHASRPVRPLPQMSAEAAGLRWQECAARGALAGPTGEDWQQAEACFGHPSLSWDENDRASAGQRTDHGYRLQVGKDVYETQGRPLLWPNPYLYTLTRNGRLQKLLLGNFSTYSPDLNLRHLAGHMAWTFDDGRLSTVIYDGADLRSTYGLEAAYAPYALRGKLIFVGRQGDRYFVVYNGQKVGPAFDHILIAYCCEPAMYSVRGGSGRYTFWGQRGGQRYMVEISAP